MHTHTHNVGLYSYLNNHCNLPPSLSSGLSSGGGAVAGVHGGSGGGNWADDGPNTRKQLLIASKNPAIDSEPAGRLTIVYHQYDKSWVVVNEA